jgi:hypothetical protein
MDMRLASAWTADRIKSIFGIMSLTIQVLYTVGIKIAFQNCGPFKKALKPVIVILSKRAVMVREDHIPK